MSSEGDLPHSASRRKFTQLLTILGLGGGLAAFMRFFFPRVLFEPSSRFKIGLPSDYGFGVDTKWQSAKRIWVVRDATKLFVIHAVCTHLGCTPDWKPSDNKFKCPCHGSGFDSEGVNFEGPAPIPLRRLALAIDTDGQIIVDKSVEFERGDGGWKDPRAFLSV
ncbi:MAG: Rieske 2Fe-2S domain-containing protein [Planctomycetes bacterium]|nr:Rieske 2Fe-2S domain-containing protein [Planctomycetota bacterium]